MESELEKIRRENRSLQEDLAQLNGQFDQLSYHNKVVSVISYHMIFGILSPKYSDRI